MIQRFKLQDISEPVELRDYISEGVKVDTFCEYDTMTRILESVRDGIREVPLAARDTYQYAFAYEDLVPMNIIIFKSDMDRQDIREYINAIAAVMMVYMSKSNSSNTEFYYDIFKARELDVSRFKK